MTVFVRTSFVIGQPGEVNSTSEKGIYFPRFFLDFGPVFCRRIMMLVILLYSSGTAQIPSRWCVLSTDIPLYRLRSSDPKDPEFVLQFEEHMPAYTTFGAPASAICDRHIPTYHIHISNHLPSSHSKYTIHHAIISSHLRQRSMYIINAIFSRNQ